MAEATADKREPRSRAAKVFLVLATLGALLITSLLLVTPICNMRWNSYAKHLRENGQPLTFAEIDELRTKLPDDQNNYLVLEPLFAELEEIRQHAEEPGIAEELPLLGMSKEGVDFFTGVSSNACKSMKRFLDQHADTLQALNAISDLPAGRIPLRIGADPFRVSDTNCSQLRTAARLLKMQNAVRLTERDVVGAVHASLLIANTAGAPNEHPSTISRLVQISNEALFVETIENTLRVDTIDEEQLRQLHDATIRRLEQATTRWCLWGERAVFVQACDWMIAGKFTPDNRKNAIMPTALIRLNEIKGTELISMLVEVADDPDAMMRTAKSIDEEVEQLSVLQFITSLMMPSLNVALELNFRGIGFLQCTHLALAAERFRMDNGHLPESLNQLVPDYIEVIPADPFDGAPMKFTTTNEGIIIYTIGKDQIDNGGSVTPKEGERRPTDEGFRLLKAEHRGLVILDTPPSQ